MDSRNNFRERFNALEQQAEHLPQQTRTVERRWPLAWSVATTVSLGLALALPHAGLAQTFQCRGGDVACLRAAITAANANGQPNTIRLAAGTYSLTAVDNDTDGPNGLPSITGPLTIRGAGAATTLLERAADGPRFRLVHVAASGNLTLDRITLRGGVVDGQGGGLFNDAGTVTLTQSTVAENSAADGGGGLFNNVGTVTLTQSTVAENSAPSGAGGLHSTGGMVTLTQSTVDRNRSSVGVGGLEHEGGTLHITRSRITGNDTFNGIGGLFTRGGVVILTRSTVAGNHGTVAGGIWIGPLGVVRLVNASVVDNSADDGALRNSGLLFITNSTVTRNSSALGGGLLNDSGTTLMLNATIAENDGSSGIKLVGNGTVTLQNTLVARNTLSDPDFPMDCEVMSPPPDTPPGRIISLGNNLIGAPEHCPITLQSSDRTGDPGLDTFRDNGMPGNGHLPLLPTSQAIDAGSDAVCPRTDQQALQRIGPCDIGAIRFLD